MNATRDARHFPTTEHEHCSCGARANPPLPPCSNGDGRDGITFAPTDNRYERPICKACYLAADGVES